MSGARLFDSLPPSELDRAKKEGEEKKLSRSPHETKLSQCDNSDTQQLPLSPFETRETSWIASQSDSSAIRRKLSVGAQETPLKYPRNNQISRNFLRGPTSNPGSANDGHSASLNWATNTRLKDFEPVRGYSECAKCDGEGPLTSEAHICPHSLGERTIEDDSGLVCVVHDSFVFPNHHEDEFFCHILDEISDNAGEQLHRCL
jgi:hypothetical protein